MSTSGMSANDYVIFLATLQVTNRTENDLPDSIVPTAVDGSTQCE